MHKFAQMFLVGSIGLALACVSPVGAHDGNRIHLTIENNKLLTGLNEFHHGVNITPVVSVFRAAFGQDPENALPNFTQFPGLSSPIAGPGALTPGTSIGFDIPGAALYWDRNGVPTFTNSPAEITISAGLNSVSSAAGPVSGFNLVAAIPSSEGWHAHPQYTLALGAADGVYVLPLVLRNSNLTANTWIVFGQNASAQSMDLAVAAIPEPASAVLLAGGGLLLLRRRVWIR